MAALISGCGTAVTGGAAAASPSSSVPAFPKTLNPDGTVPWVSAPTVDPYLTPAPAPPPAVDPTCTAGQLRGVLPAWVSGEASNDGGMDRLAAASLHGWVNLTNTSGRPCTLTGVPVVTLFSRGVPVRVSYARFRTGQAVIVGLSAHGAANFRIDWGAPYCPEAGGPFPGPADPGPFSLRAELDGLTLDIARPVVSAHGAVRFAMQVAIPTLACPTARLTISWQPSFVTGGPHTSFTVAVRGKRSTAP